VIALGYRFVEANLIALFFATAFAGAANAAYIWKVLKGNFDQAGPSVAHVGFALVLLGALISTSRQNEISRNVQGMDLRFLSEEFNNNTDLLLYKGDTVRLGEHFVTLSGKRKEGVNLRFTMDYLSAVPTRYHAGDTVRMRAASSSRRMITRHRSISCPTSLRIGRNWPISRVEPCGTQRPGAPLRRVKSASSSNPPFN
jgi:hypothetical protein